VREILIQFDNVFKKFGDGQVLKGVRLRIYQGEVTTIIGKAVRVKVYCSNISSA
jgi:ABC-type transporter Mla maintaining outer membrane lipid asymmetry ATPase subunit MlaF